MCVCFHMCVYIYIHTYTYTPSHVQMSYACGMWARLRRRDHVVQAEAEAAVHIKRMPQNLQKREAVG